MGNLEFTQGFFENYMYFLWHDVTEASTQNQNKAI